MLPSDIQAATKLWAVTQFVASTDDPKQRAWIDAYKAKFDRIADSTAIDGYDSMFVLKQVIEGAGSLTSEALQRAFGAVAYDGVGGRISFDVTGQARRALEIVQLTPKDGPGVARGDGRAAGAILMRRRVCLMVGALLLVATPVWAAIPCPIRIGSVRPESGGMAQIGQSLANGLQMGLDKAQADGGIAGCKVELVVYDSQSVPTNAATLTRRLINQDGLNLILSSPISVEALAMLEITENAGIPLYVPSAASAKITGQGYKFVWKQSMTDAIAAAAMAKYIATDLGWKKVGAIYENSDYGKPTYVNILKPGLQAGGVTVVSEDAITPGDVDLSSQLLRIKEHGADGILFWGHAKEGAILLRQNQQLGPNLPIAADTGIVYPEFLQLLPADIQAATNLVAPAQIVWTTQDPAQRAWIEAYKARFGRSPDVTAIDGYDAVFVLKQALEAAGTMDPDAVRQAIGAVSFQGVGGHVAFDSSGQRGAPCRS